MRSLGHLSRIGSPRPIADRPSDTARPVRRLSRSSPDPFGGRRRTLSQSPPRGDTQVRPREPRPPDCSAAVTTVPADAPASAIACSTSIVDETGSRRWIVASAGVNGGGRGAAHRTRCGTRRIPRSCCGRRSPRIGDDDEGRDESGEEPGGEDREIRRGQRVPARLAGRRSSRRTSRGSRGRTRTRWPPYETDRGRSHP